MPPAGPVRMTGVSQKDSARLTDGRRAGGAGGALTRGRFWLTKFATLNPLTRGFSPERAKGVPARRTFPDEPDV